MRGKPRRKYLATEPRTDVGLSKLVSLAKEHPESLLAAAKLTPSSPQNVLRDIVAPAFGKFDRHLALVAKTDVTADPDHLAVVITPLLGRQSRHGANQCMPRQLSELCSVQRCRSDL
jgi:hypothetical protein